MTSARLSAFVVAFFLAFAGLSLPAVAQAIGCDALKAEIEAKFRAGGVASVSLVMLPAAEVTATQVVVGSCDNGSRRIVRVGAPSPVAGAAAPPARKEPATPIATECKEGFAGPDCRERVPAPKR